MTGDRPIMKKLLLLILITPLGLSAQNTIGLPDVINYPKKQYGAGLQNWDIGQDPQGIIYFANNEGLLSFDGQYWKVNPLPNRTIVRSLGISPDHRIYVGGQDEIGYFSPGPDHRLSFHSLYPLIPAADRSFGDVWDICFYQNKVWFRTLNRIFCYADNSISVYHAPLEWTYMGASGDKLFAHDGKSGLLQFNNNVWQPVEKAKDLPADVVTGILPLGIDSNMISTLKSGIFLLSNQGLQPFSSPVIEKLKTDRIYGATLINKEWIAIATNLDGVQIIDIKGNLIQQFSKPEGLQNKNVLNQFDTKTLSKIRDLIARDREDTPGKPYLLSFPDLALMLPNKQ